MFSGKAVFQLVTVLALPFAGPAYAAGTCAGSAKGSYEYLEAIESVKQLPEFKRWSSSHRRVVFGERVDKKVASEGRCYWSVSVFADRGPRLEMWHVILVGPKGREILIDDADGETIPLEQWRKKSSQVAR